ncbi:hypothetical protein HOLleu_00012 [Holothuria leucospilota]|uniref:Reverse transcriptase n=1 Tax=Holothuria leucospilota TaxID=206669 RepID=A0A9Q1CN04_HOLLE|nr:hypothetical protein HOLleu_00012 [Holothuria leucospilota]
MANLLNDYFVSVFTKESSVLGTCRDSDNSSLVSDGVFSEEVVCNKLKSLKASKAPRPDGIHPAILHGCYEILSVPLCIIFQKFLDSNFVPADWRIANVTPIFKKGDRSFPCNYRPVSLTSVVCKVMESVIKDCLLKCFLNNGSQTWQMSFNADKCKVLHFGPKNFSYDYNMNGSILSDVTFEMDLGVVITGDLKPSRQCAAVAARANRVLGLIKRNFSSFRKEIVLNLYKQLVRPHLDYAAQAWSPFYEKDKLLLEQVQRRATRLIPEVRHLPYHVRLKHLGLTTLELRRIRGDMLQVYKFLSERNPLSSCNYLKVQCNSRVRGHCKKLVKNFARLDIRKFSFSHRVVNEWNSLPEWVVNSTSVHCFKVNIDKFFHKCGRI